MCLFIKFLFWPNALFKCDFVFNTIIIIFIIFKVKLDVRCTIVGLTLTCGFKKATLYFLEITTTHFQCNLTTTDPHVGRRSRFSKSQKCFLRGDEHTERQKLCLCPAETLFSKSVSKPSHLTRLHGENKPLPVTLAVFNSSITYVTSSWYTVRLLFTSTGFC